MFQVAGPFQSVQQPQPRYTQSVKQSQPIDTDPANQLSHTFSEWKELSSLPLDATQLTKHNAIQRLQSIEIELQQWCKQNNTHPILQQFNYNQLLYNMQQLRHQFIHIVDTAHNTHTHNPLHKTKSTNWFSKLFKSKSNNNIAGSHSESNPDIHSMSSSSSASTPRDDTNRQSPTETSNSQYNSNNNLNKVYNNSQSPPVQNRAVSPAQSTKSLSRDTSNSSIAPAMPMTAPPPREPRNVNFAAQLPSTPFQCICSTLPEASTAVNTSDVKRYKKVRTLRETLFGKVRLCMDTQTNQSVAVKLSKRSMVKSHKTTQGKEVAENPLAELDFLRCLAMGPHNHYSKCLCNYCTNSAIEALKQYNAYDDGSKHVLKLLSQCEDSEYYYTILEFCDKGEFFDILIKSQKFDDMTAVRYFKQLILGVQYMHACYICHLDLSLENCLMDKNDDLKICDFGVARFIQYKYNKEHNHNISSHDRPLVDELPYPGSSKQKPGKLGYMAPEIFSGSSFYGTKADVWSCGVILFVMLLGVPPFQLPTMSDQRFKLIYEGQIIRLLKAWKLENTVSKDAIDLLSKMMSPPESRITMAQVLQHKWLQR